MNIIKITVFQKNINTDISRDQKQKLITQKSDFLILPRFCPTIAKVSEKSTLHNHKIYVDKLLEISEYYKGVIIGGTILREAICLYPLETVNPYLFWVEFDLLY